MSNFEKLKVKEVIVVEGRDDTNAVLRAVDGLTIETHGFGIKKETWKLLEKAYTEKGLIILTDPDYSGEEIRRKLTARFPVKQLKEGNWSFQIVPKDFVSTACFIPIRPEEPFSYISRLKESFLDCQNGEPGIRIEKMQE
jgi:5S rRNA maturation endonuclease (ribonuclease M5)